MPTMLIIPETRLLGAPRATVAQCIRFIRSRAKPDQAGVLRNGEYTEHDIVREIVPAYYATCQAVAVDPLLLVAQMIHETGCLTSWWAGRPRRNPAGIGVTGQKRHERPETGRWVFHEEEGVWREGVAFTSWRDEAIPAHVGRMLAYALKVVEGNAVQRALIARALAVRPLPVSYRGAAPTLAGLRGRWAVPGTEYPQKIADIANAIRAQA